MTTYDEAEVLLERLPADFSGWTNDELKDYIAELRYCVIDAEQEAGERGLWG